MDGKSDPSFNFNLNQWIYVQNILVYYFIVVLKQLLGTQNDRFFLPALAYLEDISKQKNTICLFLSFNLMYSNSGIWGDATSPLKFQITKHYS